MPLQSQHRARRGEYETNIINKELRRWAGRAVCYRESMTGTRSRTVARATPITVSAAP